MRKQLCVQFASFLLSRKGYLVYRPIIPLGHDLLAIRDGETYQVLVLSVNAHRPIISLKTHTKGRPSIRVYDILLCVHPETLATWQIPATDVPDKESLFLSRRYDSYKVPFISLDTLAKESTLLYDHAREVVRKDAEELTLLSKGVTDANYQDLEDLLE